MRTFAWILGGLFLAGIIHVVSVLVLPVFATGDAWNRLARYGSYNHFNILPAATPFGEAIADMDPNLEYAVCRFDLAEGPLKVIVDIPQGYWSVGIYDRYAGNFYTLNNRSAGAKSLTLWVADQEQLLAMLPEGLDVTGAEVQDLLPVKSPARYGLIILRVLVPEESFRANAIAALENSSCQIDASILDIGESEDGLPAPVIRPPGA